jgi:RNA polymerase sigma-70 factor (ECF subfamily)
MHDCLHRIQYHNDQSAFKYFYELEMFPLFRFAYSFLKNKEASEEVVNDVFLRLWEKRHLLDTINSIKFYLYTAVKNGCLNYLRDHKKPVCIDLDSLETDHFYFALDPQQLMQTKDLQKLLEESVNTLPPKCKLIFKLVKEDGLSYKEAGALLNLSEKTIDNQLVTALRKIQAVLSPLLQDFPSSSYSKK